MQSTLISRDADPHDIFVIEPDVVLAARADYVASDPVNAPTAPPIEPAPSLAAPAPDTTPHAAANDDIQIPRDIHLSGQGPSRGRWAARATIGFLFALGSAAAAEGWNHYGDRAQQTAKAMIANWTPSALMSQPVAAADPASAQPAPAAVPSSQAAETQTASADAAPAASPSLAQDVASMGQQIAALKASIEQLKASQDQMAQQMSRDAIKSSAAAPVARTSSAKPSTAPVEPSLRAKVTAALSPRPAAPPPPHKPRPPYPPAQAAAALPPAVSAPPMPPPQPAPYQPRLQAVDQADGDPVVRPPMPVR